MNKKLILKLIEHMHDYIDMCCDNGYEEADIASIEHDLNKLEKLLND